MNLAYLLYTTGIRNANRPLFDSLKDGEEQATNRRSAEASPCPRLPDAAEFLLYIAAKTCDNTLVNSVKIKATTIIALNVKRILLWLSHGAHGEHKQP